MFKLKNELKRIFWGDTLYTNVIFLYQFVCNKLDFPDVKLIKDTFDLHKYTDCASTFYQNTLSSES